MNKNHTALKRQERREKEILAYLLKERIYFWRLASAIYPFPELARLLRLMKKKNLLNIKKGFLSLTSRGRETAKKTGIKPKRIVFEDYSFFNPSKEFLKKFAKLREKNFIKPHFDQLQLTVLSVGRKVNLLNFKGDIKGKKIVCIGDDDMMGIALVLTGLPKEVLVLDIDDELIKYENDIFKKITKKVKARAYKCDFLERIPVQFRTKYDVFITEPPDTIIGNTLFFSRGLETLKTKGVGYLGVSLNDLNEKEYFQIEKNILEMGVLITDILKRFEVYNIGTEIGGEEEWIYNLPPEFGLPKEPWFFTDIIRTEVVEKPKLFFKGKVSKEKIGKLMETNIYC